MTWVLDASAILCWLRDEPGAERVETILSLDDRIVIHAVNLVEVEYTVLRRGDSALRIARERIEAVGIEVDRSLESSLLEQAVRLKASQSPIALGDVFAIALALREDATLVSTDRGELEKIAKAAICRIEFLR